jgi:hypothetical protein
MPETFTGSCACGDIQYSCSGAAPYMGNCHCRDCQRATGSAYFPAVLVKNNEFNLLRGEPRWHETTSDRGHTMQRGFCAKCGSPLFLRNEANTSVTVLFAGSLDDPSWYKPSRDIFVKSAQPWDLMHDELPKFDAMPEVMK